MKFTERAHQLSGVPVNVALIPTQLILAFAGLLIFVALLWLRRRRVFDGQIILACVILYSSAGFIVEFWRDVPRSDVVGLSTSQSISIVILPLAFMSYFWRHSLMGSTKSGTAHERNEQARAASTC
jgi:prolipoprotein diacylglyceryltransferase